MEADPELVIQPIPMEPTTTLVVDAQPLQRLKGGVGVGHGGNSAGCRGGSDWRDSGNAGETPADIARPYLLTHSQFRRLHSLGGTPSRFASQFLDRHEMPTSKRRDRHNNEPFSGSSRHPPPSPDGNPKVPPITRLPHRFALATLYFATGGDSNAWINNANWLDSNVHECDWHKWNCTMQWLLLGGNGMRGTLSREITLLPLFGLDLMTNQLTGSLPTELGQLSTLEGLRLNDNQFSAIIPTELGHLTSSLLYLTLSSGCHTYLPWPDDEAPNVAPWSESTSKGTLSIGID